MSAWRFVLAPFQYARKVDCLRVEWSRMKKQSVVIKSIVVIIDIILLVAICVFVASSLAQASTFDDSEEVRVTRQCHAPARRELTV